MNGQRGKPVQFRVYAPAAIAGIGDCLPDTIIDRAVVINMRRRAPDEPVRKYRERTTPPEGEELRKQLTGWTAEVAGRIGHPWPGLPDGLNDREEDGWEPLIMLADLAGGKWPDLAREACVALTGSAAEDAATIGIRLLADLRDVFVGTEVMSTETLLGKLCGLDESPWADWYGKPLTARDLAKLLKPYGVKPKGVRIGDTTPRGYRREDLYEPWKRYLPPESATSATSTTCLISDVADVADVADTWQDCTVCGNPLDPVLATLGDTTHPGCGS
jgi:hypothetical protein